jgi:syntaxin-binding protein 1
MQDVQENNAGAQLAKKAGSDMSITAMAAALRKLPEFRQIMSKLDQHVNLAQQCMTSFGQSLLQLTQLEQTMSTGLDEEGRKPKSADLEAEVSEALMTTCMAKLARLRLLGVMVASQKATPAFLAKQRLSAEETAVMGSFEKMANSMHTQARSGKTVFGGMFSGKKGVVEEADDGFTDSRHVPEVKNILGQLVAGDLPKDSFPSLGPSVAGKKSEPVAESKRTRKHFGGADAKPNVQFKGGRVIVFVAGGLSYSEMRVCNDFEREQKREVIMGGSHLISPKKYVKNVASLHPDSAKIDLEEAMVVKSAASIL